MPILRLWKSRWHKVYFKMASIKDVHCGEDELVSSVINQLEFKVIQMKF